MVRVCVIGAGPGGMSFIREVRRMREEDPSVNINLVCYEKQSTWGGQWNFSWRTGVDEFGEIQHLTMHRGLWSNSLKEIIEYEEYLMKDHFNKTNLPSFLPREVVLDYLNGYWKMQELDKFDIRYNHVIKSVTYDSETDKFKVTVRDLKNDETLAEEIFDYVINCSGHFSTPHIPSFKGMETFPNTVVHTAHLKTYDSVKDKRIMVVGSRLSGDDCAVNLIKFGAKSVIVSYRSKPIIYKLIPEITQKPAIRCINGVEITFVDGSTTEVDMIILATGYLHDYPYMSDDLRLTGPNKYCPRGLHHGALFKRGGNKKLFYVGAPSVVFTFDLLKAQTRWCVMYITGKIKLRDSKEMEDYDESFYQREESLRSIMELFVMVNDRLKHLSQEGHLGDDMDFLNIIETYINSKMTLGVAGYRNVQHRCRFTGVLAAELFKPYIEIKDCSLEEFLSHY